MATFNNVSEHEKICKELNALYSAKNHDYGDSFRKTREIVPDSILVRLHDKDGNLIDHCIKDDDGDILCVDNIIAFGHKVKSEP